MAWFDEAVFYHIYPLGLVDAPKENKYEEPVSRIRNLFPWIDHIKKIGCNALYIGPLFESVGHGYETTDYKKLDSRLGTNEDLKDFVKECHKKGVKVIFDGVFNHTGRDFFAFKDIKENRENSRYRDWYLNVNFYGNNEYNDGFSYENWGGYNLLAKLNQRNGEVQGYIADVIRFWVSEFDVDGIRLDAADVLDFEFMKMLRRVANEVKPDFWLMGEVIHGDYTRWVNGETLHSVTNYVLHKALYSGHNDHNYFEIAHTVKRLNDMSGNNSNGLKLYNFVDNHDVERIYTKLNNKAHFCPVHVLMYGLPGVASIYYGSEFGIEGRKEKGSDFSLRPYIDLDSKANDYTQNPCTMIVTRLGMAKQNSKALNYGDYKEIMLTNRQYAFSRNYDGENVLVAVNNDDNGFDFNLPCWADSYVGVLSGKEIKSENGWLRVHVEGNSGDIFVPKIAAGDLKTEGDIPKVSEKPLVDKTVDEEKPVEEKVVEESKPVEISPVVEVAPVEKTAPVEDKKVANENKATEASKISYENFEEIMSKKSYEEMTVEELQAGILYKMSKNGPITDQMKKDVSDNIYPNSLLNWIKSFR